MQKGTITKITLRWLKEATKKSSEQVHVYSLFLFTKHPLKNKLRDKNKVTGKCIMRINFA